MVTFADYRDGWGGRICRRLDIDISQLPTWAAFRAAMIAHQVETDGGLILRAHTLKQTVSSGELMVLAATLAAADYAAQADDICPHAWSKLAALDLDARLAVAAAIAQEDG